MIATCMCSIGFMLREASLFRIRAGAVLWRMKMVLGKGNKGLESNQREHCCVVGGEGSDIWIGERLFLRSQQCTTECRTWL